MKFDKFISLAGYNNFSLFDPFITVVNVGHGTTNTLVLKAFTTPTTFQSDINLIFSQDWSFKLRTSDDIDVGTSTIVDCSRYPGKHTYKLDIAMSYSKDVESADIIGLLSNHMIGIDARAYIYSFYLARPVSWLAQGLASIETHSFIPSIHKTCLRKFT